MGSTAVDGIWAKDIADVMVELSSQSDLDKAAETLERSGFTMMSDEGSGSRSSRLHIVARTW